MNRKMFRGTFSVLGGIAVLLLLAVIVRIIAFPTCPLSANMTLDELNKMNLKVGYIEDSASWTSEVYETFCDNEIAGAKECDSILVGEPTGKIYFNRGTILQEVLVEEIIRGNCPYEKIWLQNGLKSTLLYDEDAVVIDGMDRSFMQKGCEYMLFCTPSATNKHSDKKVYTEADGMWFGCYNLSRDSDIVMKDNQNEYNPQIEFYTSSEKTMQCYNKTKKKLIELYINNR